MPPSAPLSRPWPWMTPTRQPTQAQPWTASCLPAGTPAVLPLPAAPSSAQGTCSPPAVPGAPWPSPSTSMTLLRRCMTHSRSTIRGEERVGGRRALGRPTRSPMQTTGTRRGQRQRINFTTCPCDAGCAARERLASAFSTLSSVMHVCRETEGEGGSHVLQLRTLTTSVWHAGRNGTGEGTDPACRLAHAPPGSTAPVPSHVTAGSTCSPHRHRVNSELSRRALAELLLDSQDLPFLHHG